MLGITYRKRKSGAQCPYPPAPNFQIITSTTTSRDEVIQRILEYSVFAISLNYFVPVIQGAKQHKASPIRHVQLSGSCSTCNLLFDPAFLLNNFQSPRVHHPPENHVSSQMHRVLQKRNESQGRGTLTEKIWLTKGVELSSTSSSPGLHWPRWHYKNN